MKRGVATRGLTLLALLCCAAPAPAQEARGPFLEGVVRLQPEEGGSGIAHATVVVRDQLGGERSTLTDSVGWYRFDRLPAGRLTVRVAHIGLESPHVEVVLSGGGAFLDLEVRLRPLEIDALLVPVVQPPRTLLGAQQAVTDPDIGRMALRSSEFSPGLVETGLAGAGAPSGSASDPVSVLHVRGSSIDPKLVLLDGAPVYAPFHIGGLLPAFDPDLLSAVAFHSGGAPARFDGGLAYVADLRTRAARPDSTHGWAELTSLAARAGFEAPLGERAGVLLAGRTLHNAAAAIADQERLPYGYAEGLLRAHLGLGTFTATLTGFRNRETVYLRAASPLDSVTAGAGADARWGNGALSLALIGDVGAVPISASASMSQYEATLPFPVQAEADGDSTSREWTSVFVSGRSRRDQLSVAASPWDGGAVSRIGLSLDRVRMEFDAQRPQPTEVADHGHSTGTTAGIYVEGLARAAPTIALRYGGRVTHFRPGGLRAAGRASLDWALTPEADLTLSVGRYHQLLRGTEVDAAVDAGSPAPHGTGVEHDSAGLRSAELQVASADHLVGTLRQRLSTTIQLQTELFLKDYRDLPDIAGRRVRSSGVDLQLAYAAGRRSLWLGYGLAWFWDPADEDGRFTSRHQLGAGMESGLVGPWAVRLQLAFSDGLPLSAVRFDESVPVAPLPEQPGESDGTPAYGFFRLDAELFGEWMTDFFGRGSRIRPSLRVVNALGGRDALFYYFEPWRDPEPQPLSDLPVLPIVGVEWSF